VSKRKVQSSRTSIHRGPLGGIHARTSTYEHEPRTGPGRTKRFAAFTGVSPWQPRRFAVAVWVVVVLALLGQSPVAGMVVVAVSAAAFTVWHVRQRIAEQQAAEIAARPAAPTPGPVWCDHCAEWTVHESAEHVA
jgi:hypothetical protein